MTIPSIPPSAPLNQMLQQGRNAPHANFNWFTTDFTVAQCAGPGRALLVQDVADVFTTKFGALMGGTVSYVHPNGSDTDDGSNWSHAFLTLAKALRTITNGTIYIWPGAYELSDFRYTDTYGDHPKKIIAPFGGVTLRPGGDDPTAATWVLNRTYGGVYQVVLATLNKPVRVLRTDMLDAYGEASPYPQLASLTALGAAGIGWAYDPAFSFSGTGTTNGTTVITGIPSTGNASAGMAIAGAGIPANTTIVSVVQDSSITMSNAATASAAGVALTITGMVLYVRSGKGENVNTTKINYRVIYTDTANVGRTLLYSSTSYWEGITFYGFISVLRVASQAVPQFWAKNCVFKYGQTHALLVEGGFSYTQNCRAHRSAADGANYNNVAGQIAQGVEINYKTEFPGDVGTWGQAQTLNPQGTGAQKNGSSNHDSYVVRINGDHQNCLGPVIADTSPSYSWNLGVTTGYNAIPANSIPSNPRYGILNQGNNAWCDGCSATGSDAGFNSDSSANVRIFNSFGTLAVTNSGTFLPYIPI